MGPHFAAGGTMIMLPVLIFLSWSDAISCMV